MVFLAEKKPARGGEPRTSGGDRIVKFSGESREERNNRRNREEGERPVRGGQGEFRRGPPRLIQAITILNKIHIKQRNLQILMQNIVLLYF